MAEEKKEKPLRCSNCRKKIRMVPVICKCNKILCFPCRDWDIHRCTYDHKAEGKEKSIKENPIIIPKKIEDF